MTGRPRRIASVAFFAALFAAATFAAGPTGPSAHSELDTLGRQAYRELWDFSPVSGTQCGFHEFDGRLGDYSPARVAALKLRVNRFLKQLDGLDTLSLSLDDRIDCQLLVSNLKMEIFWLQRIKQLERDPHFYSDECIGGVYYLLLRDFAPLAERAQRVAERLEDVPRFIKQARANIKNPPRLYAEAAMDELKDAEDFFKESADELGKQVPDLSGRLAAAADKAGSSLRSWQADLEIALPGLKDSFAMGKPNYDYLLATDKFLDFDSDSLLRMGENLFRRTDSVMKGQRAQEAEILKRRPPVPPKDEPAPESFSKQDVLADEQAEADSMRAWVASSHYATVPEWVGQLRVVETPVFLRRVIPGIAMEGAAPLDKVQTSYMYIPPLPDKFDSTQRLQYYNSGRRHGYRGGIVHRCPSNVHAAPPLLSNSCTTSIHSSHFTGSGSSRNLPPV